MFSLHKPNIIWLILIFAIGFIHCDDGLPDDPYANIRSSLGVDLSTGISVMDVSATRANINNFPFQALSGEEVKGARFVREEEKVALDYFTLVNSLFTNEVLERMVQGEKSHSDISIIPLEKYSIMDPTNGMANGAFASQSLQAHYIELANDGSASLLDAFINGAKLQEASLVTIQNQLDDVANNRDLRHLYEDLRIATRNHLRIMVMNVQANGGSYAPLFIASAMYQEIINSGFEVG